MTAIGSTNQASRAAAPAPVERERPNSGKLDAADSRAAESTNPPPLQTRSNSSGLSSKSRPRNASALLSVAGEASTSERSGSAARARFQQIGHRVIMERRGTVPIPSNATELAESAFTETLQMVRARAGKGQSRAQTVGAPSARDADARSIVTFKLADQDGEGEDVTFKLPKPSSGTFSADANGLMRCVDNHGIGQMLELAKSLAPEAIAEAPVPGGAKICVEWDPALMDKLGEFMKVAGGDLLLANHLLRSMIGSDGERLARQLKMPDGTSMYAFLRDIECKVSIPGAATAEQAINDSFIGSVYPSPAKRQRVAEFRKDFGAHALLSIANQKDVNGDIALGAFLSIGGTMAIGSAAEYGYVPAMEHRLDKNMGPEQTQYAMPAVRGVTEPIPAELYDSNVNKRVLVAMQGRNFIPRAGELVEDGLESTASSLAAVPGAVLNNYATLGVKTLEDAGYAKSALGAGLAQSVSTSVVNNWLSGVIVSYSVVKFRDNLVEKLKGMEDSGKIPKMYASDEERLQACNNTLRSARGTGTNIRAHMASAEIAMVVGAALSIGKFAKFLSPEIAQIITLISSAPTEIESTIASLAAEIHVGDETGDPKERITTDHGKQNRMLSQIASTPHTTTKELDAIARPPGEWNAALGWPIANTIGSGMRLGESGFTKAIDLAAQGAAVTERYFDPETNRLSKTVVNGAAYTSENVLKPAGNWAVEHGGKQTAFVAGKVKENVVMPAASFALDKGLKPAWAAGRWLAGGTGTVAKAFSDLALKPAYEHAVKPAAGFVGRKAVKPAANFTAKAIDTVAWHPAQVVTAKAGEIVSGRRRDDGQAPSADAAQDDPSNIV